MKQRINNPNKESYRFYGGKGLTICTEWYDVKIFVEWALSRGYKKNLTIDRINNDIGYCPENCRWVTRDENNRNKKTKRIGNWGIYPKKKGYYAQVQKDKINYYGGYSEDINEVIRFRDELVCKIEAQAYLLTNETNLTNPKSRKKMIRDIKTGHFVWEEGRITR
jgi:hypothetical protein